MSFTPTLVPHQALAAALPDARREIAVDISAPPTPDVLRRLGDLAESTAFTLTGVTPLDGGWRCHFTLSAPGDTTVGDRQLFDLLTAIGRHWPWNAVSRAAHETASVEMPALIAAE